MKYTLGREIDENRGGESPGCLRPLMFGAAGFVAVPLAGFVIMMLLVSFHLVSFMIGYIMPLVCIGLALLGAIGGVLMGMTAPGKDGRF